MMQQQIEMEHGAVAGLEAVKQRAAHRISLWQQFYQVIEELGGER